MEFVWVQRTYRKLSKVHKQLLEDKQMRLAMETKILDGVEAASVLIGTCFRRPESKDGDRYLYMRVDILAALRWESKDPFRDIPVVNLATGAVWCLRGDERVVVCRDATVVEKP